MREKQRRPEVIPTTKETRIRDRIGTIVIGHLYHELSCMIDIFPEVFEVTGK
jgi:hypothetical protein